METSSTTEPLCFSYVQGFADSVWKLWFKGVTIALYSLLSFSGIQFNRYTHWMGKNPSSSRYYKIQYPGDEKKKVPHSHIVVVKRFKICIFLLPFSGIIASILCYLRWFQYIAQVIIGLHYTYKMFISLIYLWFNYSCLGECNYGRYFCGVSIVYMRSLKSWRRVVLLCSTYFFFIWTWVSEELPANLIIMHVVFCLLYDFSVVNALDSRLVLFRNVQQVMVKVKRFSSVTTQYIFEISLTRLTINHKFLNDN